MESEVTIDNIRQHRDLAKTVMSKTSVEASHAAVEHEIQRSASTNSSDELYDDPRLHRGKAGLGYVPLVLEGRHVSKQEDGTILDIHIYIYI